MNIENNELIILEIPDDISYWLVRANGGTYYEDFFLNNFISIGDNDITIEDLKNVTDKEFDSSEILQAYKDLYQLKRTEWKWNSQQISHAASRTFKFMHSINIGDIVMVPSKRSEMFAIGIVESDVFEITDNDISEEKSKFAIDKNFKRRKVSWVKEVNRKDVSENLYWILSAHQSIFCLNDSSDYINRLLSPLYTKGNQFHGIIKINTTKKITSTDWYTFYSVTKTVDSITKSDTAVKTNVQSPGIIEFISENWIAVGAVIGGLVFGEIDFMGIKLRGIVPYFFNEGELERKKKRLENEKLSIEIEKEKIEAKKMALELEALKNDIYRDEKILQSSQEIKDTLDITIFDAGKKVSHKTQMGSDDGQDEDKS